MDCIVSRVVLPSRSPQQQLTICPADLFSKRYPGTTDAAAPGSDLSQGPLGIFQRKGELNRTLQTYMNDTLVREKEQKQLLRSGIFPALQLVCCLY